MTKYFYLLFFGSRSEILQITLLNADPKYILYSLEPYELNYSNVFKARAAYLENVVNLQANVLGLLLRGDEVEAAAENLQWHVLRLHLVRLQGDVNIWLRVVIITFMGIITDHSFKLSSLIGVSV